MIPNASEKSKAILENEVFREAVNLIESSLIMKARACDARDDIGRYRYITALNVLDGVIQHLKVTAELGGAAPKDPSNYYEEKAKGILSLLRK